MNDTISVPKSATKAPARLKATPAKQQAKSPQSEGNKLALKAADILQDIVSQIIYGESDQPRELHNLHLHDVDHYLGRLLAPECHERDPVDPEEGNILDHLALISSDLEGAVDVMERGIPRMSVALFAVVTAMAHHAAGYADRLFLAYKGLPGTLEELRTLTTVAGVCPHRERPMLPIRRVDPEPRQDDLRVAMNSIAAQASTLSIFLWQSKDAAEANHDLRAANDFLVARSISDFIGCIADECTGSSFIGGALEWANGGAA